MMNTAIDFATSHKNILIRYWHQTPQKTHEYKSVYGKQHEKRKNRTGSEFPE